MQTMDLHLPLKLWDLTPHPEATAAGNLATILPDLFIVIV